MEPVDHSSVLDLQQLTDEELVALVRETTPRSSATHILLMRHAAGVNREVVLLARRCLLPRDHVADAQQEAVLAMLEAIASYAPTRGTQPPVCSFRTFVMAVVRLRFYDFVRNFRRAERHLDRSVTAQAVLSVERRRVRPSDHSDFRRREVEIAAEEREFRVRLEAALDDLDPQAQWLWRQSVAGMSLQSMATQLGLPYHQLKYQWRKVQAFLATRLKDWNERGQSP